MKPLMKMLCQITLVVSISSCFIQVQADSGSESIIVTKNMPSDGQYERLGDIDCDLGFNAQFPTHNLKLCQVVLKNKAHSMGGDVVLINQEMMGSNACPNCILIFATVYKRQ